ncbi:MAG: asparagine--tRNA ligase [Candidatus Gastranaerophilales bacterium]|nr:asparagine--tRNA ligase [Candidatus Gastranaerophilales bacterium]
MADYKRAYISQVSDFNNQKVCIKGWLQNKRSGGKLHFLQVRDGTGVIQAVIFKGDVPENVFENGDKVTQETSIEVYGEIREDKRSKLGYEIGVEDLKIVSDSIDYPITPKEHGVAFLLENRHLWLRSPKQRAIMKIRHELIKAIRDYFNNNNFMLVDAPIFTPAACEGTTNLFEVDYFDSKAYLTQSGQLYMEAAAMAFGKVYCFGPTFRAEKSKTRRHLTEFWMVEPEVAYNNHDDNMNLAEDFVVYIVEQILTNCRFELEILERDISKLENIKKPFPRITYDEAIDLLIKKGKDVNWGDDFGADEETVISESYDRPVLIHRYPAQSKAFYMKEDPVNNKLALCVDMIAPEGYGEMIGGGQREDNLDVLLSKIKQHNLPEEAFDWYLDLRKYGSVPHAGFGLGIERTVSWLCGLHHVRETIPFPRLMDRIKP